MKASRHRLLILGGTADAVSLAEAAVAQLGDRIEVITSLAGRTRAPVVPDGRVRTGGFGGSEGLAAYLRDSAIDLLIDATHPFAARISRHATAACLAAGTPRLVLGRPAWCRRAGDDWREVPDIEAAARALRCLGRRAFLTVGRRDIAAFSCLRETWFLVRLIEPPADELPLAAYEIVLGRGPFTRAAEAALMTEHGIEVLVTKASGGAATEAKLAAARSLGLPVVMVRRPPPPVGQAARRVEDAVSWLEERLAVLDSRPPRAR